MKWYLLHGELDEIWIVTIFADVWREYTNYDVDLEKEEIADMDLSVINTGGMDVICGGAMAAYSKG